MLEKNYTPKDFEEKIYADWEESGDFMPDMSSDKDAFAVVIPPPNVTGVLHMGHALNDTLQDILIRYNRMLGKKVLWQPGMDHAGIATQMVVERNLAQEGITRHDLGREKFIAGQIAFTLETLGFRRAGIAPAFSLPTNPFVDEIWLNVDFVCISDGFFVPL